MFHQYPGIWRRTDTSGWVPEILKVQVAARVPPYRGKIERVDAPAHEGEKELLKQLQGLGYIQ